MIAYACSDATHTSAVREGRDRLRARAPARRQVDSAGRVFTRGAGGGEEARLVGLGRRLGPDGATRLAALLLASPLPGLTALDLRCTVRRGGGGGGGL